MTHTPQPSIDGRTTRAAAVREQRRAEILAAAVRVFSREGYHQTRIADIIDAADIARGTFYLYFGSKSALFLELLDDLMAQLRANVVGVSTHPGAPPVHEQLLATVTRLIETMSENRALTAIIFREAVGLDAEVDAKLRDFYANLHTLVRGSLEKGQEMGFIRALDTDVSATCVLGSIRHVLDRTLVREDAPPFDLESTASAVLDFNLRGLLR